MKKATAIMVLVMVLTGTLNTISATLQLARQATNSVGEEAYFEHYYVQTLFMMLGETLCFAAYFILKYGVNKNDPDAFDGYAKPCNPLIMFPAALLDIVGTSLGYIGLGFMKDAGFFQMLRVSPIIFCALLSIPILKQRLKWFNWTGILIVCTGIIVKAIPQIIETSNPDPDKSHHAACVEMLPNDTSFYEAPTVTQLMYNYKDYSVRAFEEEDTSSSCDSTCQKLVGIAFVLVGEFFHGCQFVYEEKYVVAYDLHPLKVVGYEGTFGVLTLAVLLWPMYFITIPKDGVLGGIALGPDGRFEDAIDAFKMIFDGGQIWLLGWTIGNMFSISVFNYAGISVTKEMSATTRSILDQIRVILIWAVFLIPWGNYLCRVQDYFVWTAAVGLVILIIGVWIYNDIIIMPLVRKYIIKSEPSREPNQAEEGQK